ncbi:acetyl-CoA C-acetyltransferase family protein, partial [Vibrio parahaemolyticus V-223/04]
KSKVR